MAMAISEPTIAVPATLLGPSLDASDEQLRELRETWGCGIKVLGDFLADEGIDAEIVGERMVSGLCDAARQSGNLRGELPLMASQVLASQYQAYALLDLAGEYGVDRYQACDVLWEAMMGFRGVQEALGLASLDI